MGLVDWHAVACWFGRLLSAQMDVTGDGKFDAEDMALLVKAAAASAGQRMDVACARKPAAQRLFTLSRRSKPS